MEENTTVVVLEVNDDNETGKLTVTGSIEELTAAAVLLLAMFGGDDCDDPDCPVHGDGSDDFSGDDEDFAGAA